MPTARWLGHRGFDVAAGVATARQAQVLHRDLRWVLVHNTHQCDVAGRDGDRHHPGTFTYNPVAFDRTFSVPENVYYVDTGIDLRPGDGVEIDGSGTINSGVIFSGDNGPDGWGPGRFGAGTPAPDAPVYSLVAQVGGTLAGPAFYVGPHFEGENIGTGRLLLRINDEAPGNGRGAFTARVRVYR